MPTTLTVAVRCLTGTIRPDPRRPGGFLLFATNGSLVMLRSGLVDVSPLAGQNATVCGVVLMDGSLLVVSAAMQPGTSTFQSQFMVNISTSGLPAGTAQQLLQVASSGFSVQA